MIGRHYLRPEKVIEELQNINPEALLADGCEDAIIGIAEVWRDGGRHHVVAYSVQGVIEQFMRDIDWDYETADEYFSVNTVGAYVGVNTPIYIDEMRDIKASYRGMPVTPEEMYEF